MKEREEYEQQEEARKRAIEAEMARLEREAKEREKQRHLAEQRDIQKKHALERIEQLKKSELGARVVQNIDEEVGMLIQYYLGYFHTSASKKGGGYTVLGLSLLLSITNISIPFSQQPCITATSNLLWFLGYGSYTSLAKFRSASYLTFYFTTRFIFQLSVWN